MTAGNLKKGLKILIYPMATSAAGWSSTGILRGKRVNLRRLLRTLVASMADPSHKSTLWDIRSGRVRAYCPRVDKLFRSRLDERSCFREICPRNDRRVGVGYADDRVFRSRIVSVFVPNETPGVSFVFENVGDIRHKPRLARTSLGTSRV